MAGKHFFEGDSVSAAKVFLIGGIALFTGVGLLGLYKRPTSAKKAEGTPQAVQEVALPAPKIAAPPAAKSAPKPASASTPIEVQVAVPVAIKVPPAAEVPASNPPAPEPEAPPAAAVSLPAADRIRQLFATDASKLPIVETVSYTSRVPWIQGRPAWIADYASHYATSRHFIARSLNKKPDYLTQKVSPGDRFNVFKKDKNLQFYLVADLSRCRLWFYYVDLDQNERVLLKTYPIGIGRVDAKAKSGFLTPAGKYSLGDKIALYKPGTLGFFQDQQIEMVSVFGTRWLPFDQEIEGCTKPAKGYGLQGAPWVEDEAHRWTEDRAKIGKCESDGCIRLFAEDIEEIFAIVITKPTTIELVKDFRDAKLPGIEKNL
jgi:L,D-transpeptidase catalytic domain